MPRLLRWVIAFAAIAFVSAPRQADAFCGFYVGGAGAKLFNDATQVVMMRDGTRTVLAMQNAYKGPPEKFAMVVPVPVVLQEQNVKTLPREVFDHVDQLSSPRLVEYWEQDPCAPQVEAKGGARRFRPAAGRAESAAEKSADDFGVTIEAKFAVGEYQIVILSAKDSTGLDAYLHAEKYTIPEGAEPYFRPYVAAGSKFFVAKVDIEKVKMEKGMAMLSPLRFHYDSEEFRLPVRLGLINSSGTQDLIVNIVAKTRYEVANYPNVTIPTNFDVAESASDKFGTFYTTLFDKTLEKNPKAVVTEYAWEPTSCDPCPGPALNWNDLATLGYDVLPPQATGVGGFRGGRGRGGGGQWVLTRLHARYTKETLGEDLVFREAKPIIGGREVRSTDGGLENGSTPAGFNNFQARYAIRHPWTGPLDCKDPKRNIWGGKPGGGGPPQPKPAAKLGLTEHVKADLATFAKADIPEIGFKAALAATPPTAGAATDVPPPKKKCGCSTGSTRDDAIGWLLGVAVVAVTLRRRRSAP